MRELDLDDDDVYVHVGPLDLGGLWSVHELDRPDLKDAAVARRSPRPRLVAGDDDEPVDLFAVLREGDVLVHHPYDSFATLGRGVHPPGRRPTPRCWPSS